MEDDLVYHHTPLEWCSNCEAYVETEEVTVKGSVGHIDDWMPDEDFSYCPDCRREMNQ